MQGTAEKPGNYLSVDGGLTAAWGLCALYILNEMFERLQWDLDSETMPLPCEFFEIIIGTGFGGIIALLLGRLRLSPSQAIDAYEKLIPALSVATAIDDEERKRNTDAFEAAFSGVLADAKLPIDAPMINKEDSKTVVCTLKSGSASTPFLLRSYRSRGSPPPDCTILQAACASVASLDKFLPVTLGLSHRRIDLTDAVVGYANPTQLLLREAQDVLGDAAKVATVVSIGLGKVKVSITRGSHQLGVATDRLKQVAANCEQVHQELEGRLNETGVYSRFNPDWELNAEESVLSSTSTYLDDKEVSNRLDEATKRVQRCLETISLKDINSATAVSFALKPRPSLVENFVGREDVLNALKATHFSSRSPELRKPAVSVLMGLGGSGKTQTALKFALEYERKDRNAYVYFFDAGSEDKLKADFELAIRTRDSASRSLSYGDALVWFANRKDPWLIIMDNADDPSLQLFHFIPKSSHANVIITTRNSTCRTLAPNSSHHIEGLAPSDAVELILKGASYGDSKKNKAYAQNIADALGNFPLALAHAAGYISVHRCLSTYLGIFLSSRAKFLASKPVLPQDYDATIAATVELSLECIPQTARDLMTLLSRFDAPLIAQSIIVKSAERKFRYIDQHSKDEVLDPQTIAHADTLMTVFCPSGKWLESDFNDIVEHCLQYSLLRVTTRGESRFYSMHVLVQAYLQSTSANLRQYQVERLVIRLLGSAVTVDNNYKYHAFNRLLSSHLKLIAIDHVTEAGDHIGLGQVLLEQGHARLSSEHLERCLALRSSSLGSKHLDTALVMAHLASSYSGLGRHRESLQLGVEVLDLRKRMLGDEHPDTMHAMAALAASYSDLGRDGEALELRIEVLDMRKKLLGDEHPDTLLAMANLASSYHDLGRYQEALELGMLVLNLQKRVSGDEHPDTVQAMFILASSYRDLGRYQEAWELGVLVLDLRRMVSGDEHPDTVQAMLNLASSYSDLGRREEALDLGLQILDLQRRLLGDEHPNTLLAMANLAVSYSDLGKHTEALKLEVQVLDLRKRLLGDDHPDTLLAMANLASSYRDLGRYQEALELKEEVLNLRKRISGDEHRETLHAMANLACSYGDLERHQEALELGEKVLEMSAKLLGEEHPDTLLVMWNLSITLHKFGREERAIALLRTAVPLREKVLGTDHPWTIGMKEGLDHFLKGLQ